MKHALELSLNEISRGTTKDHGFVPMAVCFQVHFHITMNCFRDNANQIDLVTIRAKLDRGDTFA